MIIIVDFLLDSYTEFGQLDLSCKNLVFLSVTTKIALIVLILLNAHSSEISLCTKESFNLKFAKCCIMLTMHSVFNSCIIWNVFSILNLNSWVEWFTFRYNLRKQITHFCDVKCKKMQVSIAGKKL